jgi:dihydrofolate reductase
MEKYAEDIISTVGSPVYGRVTYQGMESYWPTVLHDTKATKHDLDHARWVEDVEKIVFSETLEKVEWNNTRLIKDAVAEEVLKLKQQPGKDLVIFGSPGLARSLMQLGLIDAYQLTVTPVILGSGIPLFANIEDKINLKLVNSKTFRSGGVAFHYETE